MEISGTDAGQGGCAARSRDGRRGPDGDGAGARCATL